MALDYMEEYQKWLSSPALTAAEHEELEAIAQDPEEIRSGSTVRWNSAPPACAAP